MLRKPIGTKPAATRASDLGIGQSIIASPFGLTAQPGRKKGPFNRQIATAERKRRFPLDFAPNVSHLMIGTSSDF
jgi:hypothetical protein